MPNNEYYGAPSTPTEDFLAHYGVLGMKWGIRRAAKKGQTYQYKSHATKKYEKAAAKLAAKAEKKGSEKLAAKSAKMANRAKRSREVDRGEEEYARGISTGKAVGLALLGGTSAMKGYAQHRAMSKQSGKEASGQKVAAALTAARSGSLGSRLRKAQYIRQDENKHGVGRALYNLDNSIRNTVADAVEPVTKAYNREKKRSRRG